MSVDFTLWKCILSGNFVHSRMNCPCKYNFSDDGKKLSPRRDVPSYPKVLHGHSTMTPCMFWWAQGPVVEVLEVFGTNAEPPSFCWNPIVHAVPGNHRGPEETHVWCLALGAQWGRSQATLWRIKQLKLQFFHAYLLNCPWNYCARFRACRHHSFIVATSGFRW